MMNPNVKLDVAKTSKEQAQLYNQSGNYGRAFAHYLVAIKLVPEWKTDLKANFTSTLCYWGEELESQLRYKDLFNCYEQATEIFPENEEVLCNLGAHLFRLDHMREAAHYFRQALAVNDNYLPAYRNLQSVCNALVERWHFRMLNDSHRNEAYKEAIMKKINQGFKNVLDIGTGTGILSLYATTGGAKDVHACDYSPTMCSIAQGVFQANHLGNRITLINKNSSDLKIPSDMPQRKSLVVTEIMDCGLLGEHMLQTLLYAWDQLLNPACPQLLNNLYAEPFLANHGVVLPFGARLWAAPISSNTIARYNHLLQIKHGDLSFKSIWLYSDCSEPYDSENLRNIKDCTFLSNPEEVFTFDFNNPLQLKDYYEGLFDNKCVSFFYDGLSNGIALWFEIMLDEDITISSSPFSAHERCCWDQAIFRFKKPQESVKVRIKCCGGKLGFEIVTNLTSSSDEKLLHLNLNKKDNASEVGVSKEMISFINNKELQDVLYSLPDLYGEMKNVLDMSPFPMLGLHFVKQKNANLVCVSKSTEEMAAIEEFVKDNNLDPMKVKCIYVNELDTFLSINSDVFNFIFCNLFECTGELTENTINNFPRLRGMLAPDGVLAPASLNVMCQLVNSEWISQMSRVCNEELTETYKIAEFINFYEVSQQLDVDLRNTTYTPLSEIGACLHLTNTDLAKNICQTNELKILVVQDGYVTAIPIWYEYQLSANGKILSTYTETSHVNQIVFVVNPPVRVKHNENVTVHVTYYRGILRVKLLT